MIIFVLVLVKSLCALSVHTDNPLPGISKCMPHRPCKLSMFSFYRIHGVLKDRNHVYFQLHLPLFFLLFLSVLQTGQRRSCSKATECAVLFCWNVLTKVMARSYYGLFHRQLVLCFFVSASLPSPQSNCPDHLIHKCSPDSSCSPPSVTTGSISVIQNI